MKNDIEIPEAESGSMYMTDQDPEDAKPDRKTEFGFMQMSLAKLQHIALSGGGYKEMAAYIVLCNGVSGRDANRFCTHGAKSVAKRAKLNYRIATKSIKWLEANNIIRPPSEQEPKFLAKRETRSSTVRCVINDRDCLDVAVSKQFVEGIKGDQKGSPLSSILSGVDGTDEISRSQAVMDTILLYAALMQEQDFGDCAGVDPDAWHHAFVPIEDDEDGDGTSHVVPVPDTNSVMVTVKHSATQFSTLPFIEQVFGEHPADDYCEEHLNSRFWYAMRQLQSLRLTYRVMILWSGDPLDPKQRRRAEPIATHYINDSWARKIDPHLQHETHLAMWRSETRDAFTDFKEAQEGGALWFVGSGRYRYIVRRGTENSTFLVSQLRVRYWAANESTVQGRLVEKQRTEKFSKAMSLIGRS